MALRMRTCSEFNSPRFVYEPLQASRFIRLLGVKRTKSNAPYIYFSIESFSLDDCPTYAALSYTWGKATTDDKDDESENAHMADDFTYNISIKGKAFTITENLFDALCELGRPEIAEYMWIDALCIDQGNLDERASQVLMMGDIYAAAEKVVVWLGRDMSGMDGLLLMHDKVLPLFHAYDEAKLAGQQLSDWAFVKELRVVKSLTEWAECWGSYYDFHISRRWFTRDWVFQEVILARQVLVRCGSATISWQKLVQVAQMIIRRGWRDELLMLGLTQEVRRGASSIKICFEVQEHKGLMQMGGLEYDRTKPWFLRTHGARSPEERWYSYLESLIHHNLGTDGTTSDPRDRIYAVLGLAARYLPPDMKILIYPNYALSIEELYTSVSAILLERPSYDAVFINGREIAPKEDNVADLGNGF